MRSAVAFLTSLGPSRAGGVPGPRSVDWFPVVGAGVGALVGLIWWASYHAWSAPVAAAVAVVADLAVTGMLHFDGLLDSADGLLAPMDAARRLAVMSSPEVGAFAVAAGAGTLLLRWVAFAELRPTVLLVAGLWCLSRTAMVAAIRFMTYARPDGLASAFAAPARTSAAVPVVFGVIASIGFALGWRPLAGAVAVGSAALAAAAVLEMGRRRVGGYTGDVLGACGIVGETVGLVVAAAKW